MKKTYETPELEVVVFSFESILDDYINTSENESGGSGGNDDDDDEL